MGRIINSYTAGWRCIGFAKMERIIPNTTQVPNLIIDVWMPRLKDTEFRCLMVVTRQTIGWIEDAETGKRKEKDWISQFQLMRKTKRSARSISHAMKTLVDKLMIVEAYDEFGRPLDSPQKRMMCGGKIFYRLNLRSPNPTLFDTRAKTSGAGYKMGKNTIPPQDLRAQNLRATKETGFTKAIIITHGN